MGEVATIQRATSAAPAQDYQVIDPIPVLDSARFEQMQRIAVAMASSSMCPEALTRDKDGPLQPKTIVANCFLVVNQAVRWGMDPFGVAQCVSVVNGKLCYEGKLIAAVLDAKLGIKLVPKYNENTGNDLGVEISGIDENGEILQNPATGQPLTIEGTVGEWRTSRSGSPWADAKNHKRMLMYRGCREWARMYRPAIMLGVYAPDELDDLASASRSSVARDVTPSRRGPPPPPPEVAAESVSGINAIEHAPASEMPPAQIDEAQEPVHVETEARSAPARRAPPPPPMDASPARSDVLPEPERKPVPPADASQRIHFEPNAVRNRFANAAALATDREKLAEAWDTIVEPFKDEFFPPDLADVQKIYERRKWELDG